MSFKYMFKTALLSLTILLFACSTTEEAPSISSSDDSAGKINVLATTPMIGEYVSQVAGNNVNLTILMPPEANPHTYDPSPQDAGKISEADLIFYVGLKYEPAGLIKLLENSASSSNVLVEVGEGINPIEFKEGGHDDHGDHEGHDDHDEDKHHDEHEGHDDHDEHDEDKHHDEHDEDKHHDEHDEDKHHDEP